VAFTPPARTRPIWDFAIHVAVGGIAFITVLFVAVAVAVVIRWVESLGLAPEWLIRGFHYAEIFIFTVDILLFALFFLSEAYKLLQGIWKEIKETST
jgi:hypothetical protein